MSYQYFFSSRVNCTTFFFGYLKAMFWRMINTRLLRRWRFDTSEVNYVKLLCWQQIIFIVLIIIGNCYQRYVRLLIIR